MARPATTTGHSVCAGGNHLAVVSGSRPYHPHIGTLHTTAVLAFHKAGQPREVTHRGFNLRVRNADKERIVQLRRLRRKYLEIRFSLASSSCLRITASQRGEIYPCNLPLGKRNTVNPEVRQLRIEECLFAAERLPDEELVILVIIKIEQLFSAPAKDPSPRLPARR
jgi:hypothetical protein